MDVESERPMLARCISFAFIPLCADISGDVVRAFISGELVRAFMSELVRAVISGGVPRLFVTVSAADVAIRFRSA
jgi:hypothetical protein